MSDSVQSQMVPPYFQMLNPPGTQTNYSGPSHWGVFSGLIISLVTILVYPRLAQPSTYPSTKDSLPDSLCFSAQILHNHDPGLLSYPSGIQPVANILSLFAAEHGDSMTTISYAGCGPGQDITRWDTHSGFEPSRTSWSASSNQIALPLVQQESGIPPFLDQSSLLSPHLYTSHVAPSHYAYAEPSIPYRYPPYQLFAPTSLDISQHPAPPGFPEPSSRPHLIFSRAPHRHSAGPSRRRHAPRAIEYNGLWIDEEELRTALFEHDGKLIVHQCRWEENASRCGLWIIGDKSSINVHIQRWHERVPGGDKSQADCRWAGCAKMMLKESIPRHIVAIHLDEVWECQGCRKELVRNDAYGRHAAKSGSPACQTSGAVISYSANAREIDARAALESGGRRRYAST